MVVTLPLDSWQMRAKKNSAALRVNKTLAVVISVMVLWFAFMFAQPHKEERFLYPVYTLVLVAASAALNFVCLWSRRALKATTLQPTWLKSIGDLLVRALPMIVIVSHGVLSLMRVVALLNNYSASLQV